MLLYEKICVCSESTHAWMHENDCSVLKLFSKVTIWIRTPVILLLA